MKNLFFLTALFFFSLANAQEKTWKKLETEAYPGKQDDITFVDENTGWYVNGYGKIFNTTDGGQTWNKQVEQKGSFFRTIAFVDKNTGFAGTVGTDYFPNVTDTIPLYQTKDAGKTWSPVSYKGPYVKGLCALDIVKEGDTGFLIPPKDTHEAAEGRRKAAEAPRDFTDFAHMILENLKAAGVQQAHKEDRITFTALTGWPGTYISAEGTFMEGDTQRRAGVFIGPEFGTVSRPDLVAAAREAGDAGFDVLIACAFNYDAHSSEFDKLGRIRVLKARMNPDLHMAADLKATGAGNLFVIFGEPDIRITDAGDGMVQVQVFGVDVFKPQTGEVQSEGTDGIALWMLDTDYNEESFFVRHAYFLGANDPYKALKTTLKAEIDEEAWESLYSDTSRPFAKPKSGRIAVKVINHLGDEVMKVFAVE